MQRFAGQLGHSACRGRSMEDRLREFFSTIQSAAAAVNGPLEVNVKWTRERDPRRIATKLTAGTAIENLEGPDATPEPAEFGRALIQVMADVVGER